MKIFGFGFNGFGQLDRNGDECIPHPQEMDIHVPDDEYVAMVTACWSTVCAVKGEELTLQGFLDCKANQQCTLQSPFQIQHVLLTEETLTVIGKSSTQQALYKHATDTVNVKISKVVIVCEDLLGEDLQGEIKLRSIVSGELHTVAVTDDQEVGEITHINDSLIFRPLPFQTAVNQVCCGKEHVLILTLGGEVYTYGLGSRGQLGHGTTEKELKPRVVEALQGVTMATIAAGGWHSAALSAIGDVYIWGWNESGQLGLPMKQQTNRPERHQCSQENVTDKTVESDYKLSFQQKCYQEGRSLPKRTTDMEIQSVYSEHKNDKCHSCHSVVETSQTELAVPESGPTSVSLKADDGMSSGVSGNSDYSREDVDVIVLCQMFPCLLEFPEEVNVSKVSCGSRHTAAVTESGDLYTWGWNEYGQLGHCNRTTTDIIKLVQYFRQHHYKVSNVTCGPWNTLVSVYAEARAICDETEQ